MSPLAHVLISPPEKAFLDKCYLDGPRAALAAWALQSLRLEDADLRNLRRTVLKQLAVLYGNKVFCQAIFALLKEVKV